MFDFRIIDKAHIAQFSLKIEIMIQRVPTHDAPEQRVLRGFWINFLT